MEQKNIRSLSLAEIESIFKGFEITKASSNKARHIIVSDNSHKRNHELADRIINCLPDCSKLFLEGNYGKLVKINDGIYSIDGVNFQINKGEFQSFFAYCEKRVNTLLDKNVDIFYNDCLKLIGSHQDILDQLSYSTGDIKKKLEKKDKYLLNKRTEKMINLFAKSSGFSTQVIGKRHINDFLYLKMEEMCVNYVCLSNE